MGDDHGRNGDDDGESSPLATLDSIATSFRKRTLVTAKLAGKMGMKMAARTLRGRRDPSPADSENAIAAARELVSQLGALKGLVMKVGQMASYLPGALPDEAQRVLSDLQASSTAMSFDRVREVVERELGDGIDALFEDFAREPFAAASIGQVHLARFRGRKVAVKVQYPGIEDVLASDLSTFSVFAKLGTLGLPMDAGALAAELSSRILEECDYTLEAKNQRELARLFGSDPYVHVPDVILERSTRRVLTTEHVSAARFADFVAHGSRAAKDRAGDTIFRTCFNSLFRHGVYNGDPHPGNYLFHEDGRVTFLDFGCVRRFDPTFIERWKAFGRCILDQDRAGFPERFRALGFVGKERGFDFDHQWRVTQYLYTPFLKTDPYFTYDDEYVRESYGLMIFDNPNQRLTAMPPEWLLLNRLQWGMNAVLAKLEATAPWPVHFADAVNAPFEGTAGAAAEATVRREGA